MTPLDSQKNAAGNLSKQNGTSTTSAAKSPVDPVLERLTHLLPSLLECQAARDEVEASLPRLTTPAQSDWLMARIAALLHPYYEKDVPQGVRMMEAEDWAVELDGYPRWAVEKAVRWWKSGDNPKRQKRPLEGDISARCRKEMDAVLAAQKYLEMPCYEKPAFVVRVKPEDAAYRKAAAEKIMREVFGK